MGGLCDRARDGHYLSIVPLSSTEYGGRLLNSANLDSGFDLGDQDVGQQ